MAQLLAADFRAEHRQEQRQDFRNGARRDLLPTLRRPPGTRVRRWAETHGLALLHEFGCVALHCTCIKRGKRNDIEEIGIACAACGTSRRCALRRSVALTA